MVMMFRNEEFGGLGNEEWFTDEEWRTSQHDTVPVTEGAAARPQESVRVTGRAAELDQRLREMTRAAGGLLVAQV